MRVNRVAMLALVTGLLAATPAFAQVDLSGNWAARLHEDWIERAPGPDPVDYLGLPISEEGRLRALTYTAAAISQPDRQCLYYPPHYVVIGPQGFKVWSEADAATGRTIAWKIAGVIDRSPITIWMDGRPHPSPNAPHTFAGFTTGVWEGNTLATYTTHVKEGFLRRNGVPMSDETTFTMHISRYGNTLTIVAILEDPIDLTEPHILSRSWQLDETVEMPPTPDPCVPEVEVPQAEGAVAHILPGQNPAVGEVTALYRIPLPAVLGGAQTMYPEFRKTLKDGYVRPDRCIRYCCGPGNTAGPGCITGGAR